MESQRVGHDWTHVCAPAHTHLPSPPHKDIQQFLLQTHVVEHQKPSANRTKTSRHPKIMILVPFHVWEDASVWLHRDGSFDKHLNYLVAVSCFFILNSPRGAPSELRLWLKAWQWATCWTVTDVAGNIFGSPHNYALEIRYLSLPEGQTSHSSILKWIFKRVLKTHLSSGYSQIDGERDEIFKFIYQRFPESLLCEHFSL